MRDVRFAKKVAMTRSDIAWIAIRLIGLYLAIQAITSVVQIGFEFYALERANEAMARGMDVDKHIARIYGSMFTQTVYFVLYVVLSFYCLRKGGFVHKLLMYTRNAKET